MKNFDLYEFKRWVWLVIIFTFLLAMCSSCSATYHLKKAYKKDPSLVLKDTIKEVQIRAFETFKTSFDISTLDRDNIVLESLSGTDTVKIYVYRDGAQANLEIDCPDCIDSIVYVPQVRFVKEELSQRELYKEAKERLSDWNKIRLMKGELISVFFLGILAIILLRIFLRRFL